jgi:hypothetical protein
LTLGDVKTLMEGTPNPRNGSGEEIPGGYDLSTDFTIPTLAGLS